MEKDSAQFLKEMFLDWVRLCKANGYTVVFDCSFGCNDYIDIDECYIHEKENYIEIY